MSEKFRGILSRYYGQREWLKDLHPETFKEQKHLDRGSPERAYWHHGYMMAIGDIFFGAFNGPEDIAEQVVKDVADGKDFTCDGTRFIPPSWYPKTTLEERTSRRDISRKERDEFYESLSETA